MKLSDLSAEIIEKIKALRYDSIIEKHEGPWQWESDFEYGEPEIMDAEGRPILLPIEKKQRPNITFLRIITSEDGNTLTIFLKDTTYTDNPKYEWADAGRLAICEKIGGADLYVATVYHEWFIVENEGLN